jgi:hypothetical protein
MNEADKWILGCTIVVALCTIAAVVISVIALNKKQEVRVDQPVSVTITEELHKIFAAKAMFEKHVSENREDHDKIFSKIGGVERGAKTSTDAQVEVVRRDLVHVSNQVAGLQVETKLQNAQLSRMEKNLTDMPSKIVADIVNAKKL